jgi:protein-L-isoaspartate(D-aspartate) O-methyltransferase
VLYVNAGVVSPDPEWLRALRPGGRLIFPWQPLLGWGHAVLVTRTGAGFTATPLMKVGFIRCSGGAAEFSLQPAPSEDQVAATRSVWLADEKMPDATATAIYGPLWFSSTAVP